MKTIVTADQSSGCPRGHLESTHVAVFLATSGHSGVDRVAKNLIHEWSALGIRIDLLKITGHGPYFDEIPSSCRLVHLRASHVNSSLPGLLRYLRHHQPEVLFTDKDRVNRLALLAKRISRSSTRVVVRVGTTVSTNLKNRGMVERVFQLYSMRRLYLWADAVLVPSHHVAEDLAEISRLGRDRIKVVPSPVVNDEMYRLAAATPGHPWLQSREQPVILGIGELSARKDFTTLLRAYAEVRRHRSCRLVILGRGRQHAHLSALAKQLDVENNVFMPGFVPNPYAYLSRASMFVLASRYEGAPIALIEALALGIPCVSTNCPGGAAEILQHGKYGILVPVGDFKAMADAIITTLDHPADRTFLQASVNDYRASTSATRYLNAMGIQLWN